MTRVSLRSLGSAVTFQTAGAVFCLFLAAFMVLSFSVSGFSGFALAGPGG
jgi:hypothetical protein